MKVIAISFSLKEQNFEEIKQIVLGIVEHYKEKEEDVLLVHGFMPRRETRIYGLSNKVNCLLERHFPVRLNMYTDRVLRQQMAEIVKKLDGTVYMVGEIKGGVKIEFDLYSKLGVNIIHLEQKKLKF
jgi:hypothetical protein